MSGAARPDRGVGRLLATLLLLGVAAWMTRAHWEDIDLPHQAVKLQLHEDALANRAPDPYQYKLWAVTHAVQAAADLSGRSLGNVYFANTLLSLLLLVFLHHLWLRTYVSGRAALVGALALGALANVLFLTYMHHPYEFWGVALFCWLLRDVQRDAPWWRLALLCLVTGLVWEKHALVPALWGIRQLALRRAFLPALGRGLAMLAAAVAVPVTLRLALGTERAAVDGMTTLALQEWDKVLWFQLSYVLPFLAILIARGRSLPGWVRLLWLQLPLLAAAYVTQQFVLHEVRSFWALAPVLTATLVCGLFADERHADAQSAGPQSCQAAQ